MTDLILNERQTPKGLLVSVCDADVLGETFEEGEVTLTVTEEFYGGDTVEEETAVESMGRAAVANLVGTRAVELAIEAGLVEESGIMDVDGTRHAQFLRV